MLSAKVYSFQRVSDQRPDLAKSTFEVQVLLAVHSEGGDKYELRKALEK
jgi:hypothetical protein